jgi:hypothetical protein
MMIAISVVSFVSWVIVTALVMPRARQAVLRDAAVITTPNAIVEGRFVTIGGRARCAMVGRPRLHQSGLRAATACRSRS